MDIIKKLSALIEEKGIRLTEIARGSGISKQNLNRILKATDIKYGHLVAICKAIGVAPEDLIISSGQSQDAMEKKNEEIKKLEEKISELEIGNRILIQENKNLRGFKDFFSEYIRLFLKGFLEHPNAGKVLSPLVSIFNANPEIIASIEKYPAIEKEFMAYFARLESQLDPAIIEKLLATPPGTEL